MMVTKNRVETGDGAEPWDCSSDRLAWLLTSGGLIIWSPPGAEKASMTDTLCSRVACASARDVRKNQRERQGELCERENATTNCATATVVIVVVEIRANRVCPWTRPQFTPRVIEIHTYTNTHMHPAAVVTPILWSLRWKVAFSCFR